jgi:hypothetical protein
MTQPSPTQALEPAYRLYQGEYPVVVLYEQEGAAISVFELDLTPIVQKHQLDLEKTVWLVYFPQEASDQWWAYFLQNKADRLSLSYQNYVVSEKLLKALVSRCQALEDAAR